MARTHWAAQSAACSRIASGSPSISSASSKRDGAPIGSGLPRGLQVLLESAPELPLEVAETALQRLNAAFECSAPAVGELVEIPGQRASRRGDRRHHACYGFAIADDLDGEFLPRLGCSHRMPQVPGPGHGFSGSGDDNVSHS